MSDINTESVTLNGNSVKLIPPNPNDSPEKKVWVIEEKLFPKTGLQTTTKSSLKASQVALCENALKKVSREHPEFFGPNMANGGNLKISMMFVHRAALKPYVSNRKKANDYYVNGELLAQHIRNEILLKLPTMDDLLEEIPSELKSKNDSEKVRHISKKKKSTYLHT